MNNGGTVAAATFSLIAEFQGKRCKWKDGVLTVLWPRPVSRMTPGCCIFQCIFAVHAPVSRGSLSASRYSLHPPATLPTSQALVSMSER